MNETHPLNDPAVRQALLAPFQDHEISFLPRKPEGGRALAVPYIDARAVMTRLDHAVGPAAWEYDFDPLSVDGKMVRGKLTVFGVTKCDPGQANDEAELMKSASSDALKRCAVHFGIGRYLYYLDGVWWPYADKHFKTRPQLKPEDVAAALRSVGYRLPTAPEPAPIRNSQPAFRSPNPVVERVTQAAETAPGYATSTGAVPSQASCGLCGGRGGAHKRGCEHFELRRAA